MGQKKRLPASTGSLLKSQRPRNRRRQDDYIALLVVVVVVFVVVDVVLPVAFMSIVVRFSSTFMVLLALSLLLHAATARAAPATRIRARIQDSLFIAI